MPFLPLFDGAPCAHEYFGNQRPHRGSIGRQFAHSLQQPGSHGESLDEIPRSERHYRELEAGPCLTPKVAHVEPLFDE